MKQSGIMIEDTIDRTNEASIKFLPINDSTVFGMKYASRSTVVATFRPFGPNHEAETFVTMLRSKGHPIATNIQATV